MIKTLRTGFGSERLVNFFHAVKSVVAVDIEGWYVSNEHIVVVEDVALLHEAAEWYVADYAVALLGEVQLVDV